MMIRREDTSGNLYVKQVLPTEGTPESSTKPLIYVNGIYNTYASAIASATEIASGVQSRVTLVWNDFCQNRQEGPEDACLLVKRLLSGEEKDYSDDLSHLLVEEIERYAGGFEDEDITILAHSHGATILSKALGIMQAERKSAIIQRCRFVTCGAALLIKLDHPNNIKNYIHHADLVSQMANGLLTKPSPSDDWFSTTIQNFARGFLGVQIDNERSNEAVRTARERFESIILPGSRLLELVKDNAQPIGNVLGQILQLAPVKTWLESLGVQQDDAVSPETKAQAVRDIAVSLNNILASNPQEDEYNTTFIEGDALTPTMESITKGEVKVLDAAGTQEILKEILASHAISNYLINPGVRDFLGWVR